MITNTNNIKNVFIKRKLYILFSIISGLIISWSLIYNFTTLAHDTNATPTNQANLSEYFNKWSWFLYFTTISNLLFFFTTTIRIFYRKSFFSDQLQIIVGSYMFIVGIIYWTAIGPFSWDTAIKAGRTSMLAPNWFLIGYIVNDFTLHLTTVIMAITLSFIGIRRMKYKFSSGILKALVFPILYYIFAWVLYIITSTNNKVAFIYQFLNFYQPFNLHFSVLITVFINISIFCVILFLFITSYYIFIKSASRKVLINKTVLQNKEIIKNQNEVKIKKNIIKIKSKKNKLIPKKRIVIAKKKIVIPKKRIVIAKTANNVNVKYIIQKSSKTKGWELKRVGGTRATYIASTKLKVQEYYSTILKSNANTTMIEKDRHGKIRTIKKMKNK